MLRGRITPNGTSIAGIQRIQRFIVNGSDIKTSGLDYAANYTWNEVLGGSVTMGLEGTYQLEYESDDFISRDGIFLANGGDFVGLSNEGVPFTPLPELKTSFFIKWGNDRHRLTIFARHVDGYQDVAPDTPEPLRVIDSHSTVDLTYVNTVSKYLTFSVSGFNLTDEDPPQVANDLNDDPYNHSGFGRMIKLGFAYQL